MSEFTANLELAATANMAQGTCLWDDGKEIMFERKPLKFSSIYDDKESPEVASQTVGDLNDPDSWFVV